jgi:hypothetical protein
MDQMKFAAYAQQPGRPKPLGNPPSNPEPDRKAPIEEPPAPVPLPQNDDEPPPMDAD